MLLCTTYLICIDRVFKNKNGDAMFRSVQAVGIGIRMRWPDTRIHTLQKAGLTVSYPATLAGRMMQPGRSLARKT
jgi:hypothetical protein